MDCCIYRGCSIGWVGTFPLLDSASGFCSWVELRIYRHILKKFGLFTAANCDEAVVILTDGDLYKGQKHQIVKSCSTS